MREQEKLVKRDQSGPVDGRRPHNNLPPSLDHEAVRRLTELVRSLLQSPPTNPQALDDRYGSIKDLIKAIETGRGREDYLEDLLSSIDTKFNRVRRTFSLLKPGFLNEVGSSLFATQYRFFVGGLEGYLKKLSEISEAALM